MRNDKNLTIILIIFAVLLLATVVCNEVGDNDNQSTPASVTVVSATSESNWPDTWDGPLPEIVTRGENND